MYRHFFKRIFDFLVAFAAFILFSPIFVVVMILLFLANDGKPFFFQIRPGKGEKLFRIIKFRTMNNKKDTDGNLLHDAERLTRIGNIVRKTSLDEIPQLLNVIAGQMSLVGPRPLLPDYLPFYTPTENRRHEVKPGITGWAQVNGRNAISWPQKFEYDVWYVDHASFLLDIRIVLKTIRKIIATNEIAADGHVTMPRFDEFVKKQTKI
ncbi:MAG: sugar transferase [Flavobacterium sp.]|nr:sugar transferase [Flavobacterium sp.]